MRIYESRCFTIWSIISVELIKGEVDFYLIREAKPNPKARLKNKMSMLWKKETFI